MFDTSVQLFAVAAVSLAGLAFVGAAALVIGVILYRPARGRRRRTTIPAADERNPRNGNSRSEETTRLG